MHIPSRAEQQHQLALTQVSKHHDRCGLAAPLRHACYDLSENSVVELTAKSCSLETFRDDYVARNTPVVIHSSTSDCPAVSLWQQNDYLVEHVGHARVRVRTSPSSSGVFGDAARLQAGEAQLYEHSEISVAELLAALSSSEAPSYYGARIELQEDMPELIPDIMTHYELPWRLAFGAPYKGGVISYIGSGRQSTPLHFDDLENLVVVIRGSKELLLFPPSQSEFLYPAPQPLGTLYSRAPVDALHARCPAARNYSRQAIPVFPGPQMGVQPEQNEGATSQESGEESAPPPVQVDSDSIAPGNEQEDEDGSSVPKPESEAEAESDARTEGGSQGTSSAPRGAESFPLLSQAKGVHVRLEAGDMLYVPCGWWHSVSGSQELNITLNYWFAQSPEKEDSSLYLQYLQENSQKWLKQLDTMGLPASVMKEALEEAPRMVEEKSRARRDFCWPTVTADVPYVVPSVI